QDLSARALDASRQQPPPVEQPPFPDQRKPKPPDPPPPPGQKKPRREEPTLPGQIRQTLPLFPEKDLAAIGRLTFPVLYDWTTMLPGSVAVPPAYDGEQAYLSLRDGQFVSIDLRTGLVRWSRELAAAHTAATGGTLVFVDTADTIHALDMETGRDVWTLPFPSGLTIAPHFDTGWLILASADGDLIGIRANDGQTIWRVALGACAQVAPAAAGDRLYVGLDDKRVVALQLEDGVTVWEQWLGDVATGIVADQERVFAGSMDNFLYCLDARIGRHRWHQRTGGDVVGAPIMDESRLYLNSLDNLLRAYDRKNGALRWKRALPFRPASQPVRVGDVLLVSGLASQFRAYETEDGDPVGVFDAPDDLGGPLHALESLEPFGSRVIVLLARGQLMALQQAASPIPSMLTVLPGENVPLELPPVPVTPVGIPLVNRPLR
ncbi:MAG: PQQ-binding-like beta-propeller repeat protein, partial [Acidobacteria bacterium]|nr:PQQ-binding-like beta-propeller repeat protein [Acidobacteriota bacterium]